MIELLGFPVGQIAGVILSVVVVAMVGAKLVCAVSSGYRQHCAASSVSKVGSDTDEQRDILTAGADDQHRHADIINDDDMSTPSYGQPQANTYFNEQLKRKRAVLRLKYRSTIQTQ